MLNLSGSENLSYTELLAYEGFYQCFASNEWGTAATQRIRVKIAFGRWNLLWNLPEQLNAFMFSSLAVLLHIKSSYRFLLRFLLLFIVKKYERPDRTINTIKVRSGQSQRFPCPYSDKEKDQEIKYENVQQSERIALVWTIFMHAMKFLLLSAKLYP